MNEAFNKIPAFARQASDWTRENVVKGVGVARTKMASSGVGPWVRNNLSDVAIASKVRDRFGLNSVRARVLNLSDVPPGGFNASYAMLGAAIGGTIGAGRTAIKGDGRYGSRTAGYALAGGMVGAAFDPRARALATAGYGKAMAGIKSGMSWLRNLRG